MPRAASRECSLAHSGAHEGSHLTFPIPAACLRATDDDIPEGRSLHVREVDVVSHSEALAFVVGEQGTSVVVLHHEAGFTEPVVVVRSVDTHMVDLSEQTQ